MRVDVCQVDHAERIFSSVAHTWRNASGDTDDFGLSDVKELTPEWFYLPDFLVNRNRFDLGMTQAPGNCQVDDVVRARLSRCLLCVRLE